jgi:hypothetical protein
MSIRPNQFIQDAYSRSDAQRINRSLPADKAGLGLGLSSKPAIASNSLMELVSVMRRDDVSVP